VTRYAASATALATVGQVPPAPAGRVEVLSVSEPAYGSSDAEAGGGRLHLPRLPGTAAETRAIVSAFQGAAAVEVLQGATATEPRVTAALPGKRYVHIATHGLVDTTQGDLFATLVLAPPAAITATADDGQLQLFEIYGLRLDAELAALSACVTRAGKAVPGEGVFALSRAFMAAGARRVVASLWEAEDESTAELMGSLFGRIAAAVRAGKVPDYARALAEAKRRVRARPGWEAPFFWAPFILDGVR
jgi:CHAT domain-containing protein